MLHSVAQRGDMSIAATYSCRPIRGLGHLAFLTPRAHARGNNLSSRWDSVAPSFRHRTSRNSAAKRR